MRLRLPSIRIHHRRNGVADGNRGPEGLGKALDHGEYVTRVIGAVYGDENPVYVRDGWSLN